jgi:hypothetical protein
MDFESQTSTGRKGMHSPDSPEVLAVVPLADQLR